MGGIAYDIAVDTSGTESVVTITTDDGTQLSQAEVEALLRSLEYDNSATNPTSGERTITIVANDGTADSEPVTSTINVNNPPAIDLNDDGTTTDPDFAATFNEGGSAVNVADTDADVLDGGENDITLLSIAPGNIVDGTNEIITFNGNNGATASFALDGSDTASQSLTIGTTVLAIAYNSTNSAFEVVDVNGTNAVLPQVALDALVRGISYENTSGSPTSGDRTFSFTVTDANNLTGDPALSTITVVPNTPADAVDNSYNTDEETDATGNLITNDTGSGVDTGDGTLTVTANTDPTDGTVTVAANGDFTYTPDADFVGTDTFTYTIQDADGDADTATVTITVDPVNDAPVNTVPTAQTTAEGTNVVFNAANGNGISINDIDAGSNDVEVSLTSTNGGTFTGLGDTANLTNSPSLNGTSITLTGSQTEINEALSGLTLTPNGTNDDTITITTNDLGNTGNDPGISGDASSEEDIDTINIDVIANSEINTPPVNTVPASQTTAESSPGVFQDVVFSTANSNAISITDAEANPTTDTVEVILNATNGILNLSTTNNLTITNGTDNSTTVTIRGTIENINTALEGLSYSPTGTGNGSIDLRTNDLGIAGIDPSVVNQPDTGSDSDERDIDTVSITTVPFENINQAPDNTVPTTQTTTEGTDVVFSTANGNAISINDTDAGSNDVEVSLTSTNGNLTALGDTAGLTSDSGVGTSTVTLIGSQSSINIALEGLTYSPTGTDTGSIQVVTNDLGNTGVDPSTVGLPNTGDATSEEDTDNIDITISPAPSTGTINGQVWTDNNFDGVNDLGENGLDGVTVELFDSNGNLQKTTTSTADGLYEFTDIVPQDYYLEFTSPEAYVLSPQDVGSDDTIDSDVNRATGQTDIFTVQAGDSFANIDAGLSPDTEGDTIPDIVDGTGDRDNDGTPNFLDVDPAGYFYNQKTGEILTGGEITVTGPGAINITEDASATGHYEWFIDGTAGTYTMGITPPTGYILSPNRLSSDPPALDPTGLTPDPYEIGSPEDGTTDILVDFTAASNPYYLTFDLAAGDPFIINNNIPFVAPPTLDLNGGDAGTDYSTSFTGSEVNIADAINATGSDLDGTDIETLTLSIAGVTTDAANETLTIGNSTPLALNANNSLTSIAVTGATDTFDVAVTDNGTTFTITKNGGGDISQNDVDALLRDITYDNAAATPTFGDRTITMLLDDGISDSNPAISTIELNTINGTTVSDTLLGTTSDEIFTGGKGQDTLTGNGGNDTFHFNETSEGIDIITDFDTNGDLLDFRSIVADELGGVSNPWTGGYIEANSFGSSTNTMIQVDYDPSDSSNDILTNKNVVLLENVDFNTIDENDFLF